MYRSLSSFIPNPTDLLSLEVEELAGVLLMHLNSYEGAYGNSVYQNGQICQSNFLNAQTPTGHGQKPEYGEHQPQVNRALMEAWSWLASEGFLIRDPAQPAPWFFVSRRGQRLKSRENFEAYRKASLLPKGQLHPLIATEVYPAFLRGKYDTAIFEAFREVEVAVREAAKLGPDDYGTALMRDAFRPAEKKGQFVTPGPLTDAQLPTAEQEAMANLFAGAVGFYKNPQSHRHVPTHPEDAAEVIAFASQLLRIVDRLKPQL
ncbi:MAG: TIGR02391 family protein [Candidatus Acidiferrales bacterium]